MKQQTLNIPGMKVPRPFVFAHGFVSGRLKVAGLDPETECICSGYITEKLNLYDSVYHNRVQMLENETRAVRSEAFDIMAEEAQIRQRLAKVQAGESQKDELIANMKPASIQEIRDVRKHQADKYALHSEQDELIVKHRDNIKRLGEIDEKIRSCELRAQEELEATATALQSIFATYTKGVLLRPIHTKYIPIIEKYDFKLYKQSHKIEDDRMRNILKEEVFNYE